MDASQGATNEVPEGAAVFPIIPEELGVHPLTLAVLHAVVFFDGSDEEVINDAAADEALNYIATYLQRLSGPDLKRFREDLDCLAHYARQEKWPTDVVKFLESFLKDYGIGAAS